jgi:hypothetical protein
MQPLQLHCTSTTTFKNTFYQLRHLEKLSLAKHYIRHISEELVFMSALSELQTLERDIAVLKKVLKSYNTPTTEKTSIASIRIYNAIIKSENVLDHFAPQPKASVSVSATNTSNHTSTSPNRVADPDAPDGCCTVC